VSQQNSGPNPLDKQVLTKLAGRKEVQNLPLSEVMLVGMIAIEIYRNHLTADEHQRVQASGFEMTD